MCGNGSTLLVRFSIDHRRSRDSCRGNRVFDSRLTIIRLMSASRGDQRTIERRGRALEEAGRLAVGSARGRRRAGAESPPSVRRLRDRPRRPRRRHERVGKPLPVIRVIRSPGCSVGSSLAWKSTSTSGPLPSGPQCTSADSRRDGSWRRRVRRRANTSRTRGGRRFRPRRWRLRGRSPGAVASMTRSGRRLRRPRRRGPARRVRGTPAPRRRGATRRPADRLLPVAATARPPRPSRIGCSSRVATRVPWRSRITVDRGKSTVAGDVRERPVHGFGDEVPTIGARARSRGTSRLPDEHRRTSRGEFGDLAGGVVLEQAGVVFVFEQVRVGGVAGGLGPRVPRDRAVGNPIADRFGTASLRNQEGDRRCPRGSTGACSTAGCPGRPRSCRWWRARGRGRDSWFARWPGRRSTLRYGWAGGRGTRSAIPSGDQREVAQEGRRRARRRRRSAALRGSRSGCRRCHRCRDATTGRSAAAAPARRGDTSPST